jgi:lipopolysaccharide export system permease protein
MRTVRRLIFRTIINHVTLVALAFSALAFFIDFVEEIQKTGKDGYAVPDAVWTCLLLQGAHFYDLFPIALLIGATLALAKMAQTSEFTILRTGGLGPWRALGLLGILGGGAAALMIVVSNWLVPMTEQQLTLQKAKFSNNQGLDLGHGGTWLRERVVQPDQSAHQVTVNVGSADKQDEFAQVRIFEFDEQGRLLRRLSAKQAKVEPIGSATEARGSVWYLRDVQDTQWLSHELLGDSAVLHGTKVIAETHHQNLVWHSSLTPLVVSASVLPPETMSTYALWRYTQHLSTNAQAAQRYEIEFWSKSFYPLVCLVMVALALPFAYLHARSGGMSLKIFGGIMVGISFVLANHISSHLGLLHDWRPWLAALAPSLFYLVLSMSAFTWLVRYR